MNPVPLKTIIDGDNYCWRDNDNFKPPSGGGVDGRLYAVLTPTTFNVSNVYCGLVQTSNAQVGGTTTTKVLNCENLSSGTIACDNITGKTITGITTQHSNDVNSLDTRLTTLETKFSQLMDKIYPIGSIYLTLGNTPPPIGGTWRRLTDGRFIRQGTDADLGKTGGVSTHTHTTAAHALSITEIPSHMHGYALPNNMTGNPDGQVDSSDKDHTGYRYWRGSPLRTGMTTPMGGTDAHSHGDTGSSSNIPPYIYCAMWQRTG